MGREEVLVLGVGDWEVSSWQMAHETCQRGSQSWGHLEPVIARNGSLLAVAQDLVIPLKGQVAEREERQSDLPFAVISGAGLGQSQKLVALQHGSRGPRAWAILCCFSRDINRKLNWKQGTNQCPYRVLVPQVAALPTMLQHWP